jgi:hypothetical protein
MEFCDVSLRQMDEGAAEIKVVVNTEVLLTLLRKKRHTEIGEWFNRLEMAILEGLNREFGEGDESMGDVSIRTHVGLTTNLLPFASALAIVEVKPEGGGLTSRLGNTILRHLMEAVQDSKPLVGVTATSITKDTVTLKVEFDVETLREANIETLMQAAKDALENEIQKGYWNIRL